MHRGAVQVLLHGAEVIKPLDLAVERRALLGLQLGDALFQFLDLRRERRLIDVVTPRIDDEPEFDAWRWEPLANTPKLIVPFKRSIYENVAKDFAKFATG